MKRLVFLLLLLSLLGVSAYAVPINLGTASTFGLLGGSAVTNTGSSVISGDVGSSPTPAVTGFPPGIVLGTLYTTPNAVTAQAQTDLTTAYNVAAGAAPTATLTGTDLGSFNAGNPLGPGVYFFASSALLTGNLTLDGQGDPNAQWVFQIGTTLTTATNATVSFINGASPCNVFWQVGSSATIQTNTIFAGTIMALASITLDGGTLNGRALARNGAVTISAAEFVNPACPEPAVPCVTMAKVADRMVASVGDVITYTYTVANCGTTNLTVSSVIDSRLGNLTADFIAANGGTSTLAAGAFASFTETHTVLSTDISPIVNVATVSASSGGVPVTDTAQASVNITAPTPSVTMKKTANRTVASVGDIVTYTYMVCNTGTAPLTVNSVVDSVLGDITADFVAANGGTSTLAAGACTSFNELHTVLATDSSPLTNVATVSATGGGVTVTGADTATVLITAPVPSVSIVKTADRLVASVGDVITYTLVVANTGATPLTVNSVIDSRIGNVTADFIAANGGSSTLAIGASVTFAVTYTVLATDSSPLINVATVNATGNGVIVTGADTASVLITAPVPSVSIVKTADRLVASAGDVITYTLVVANTGATPLTVNSVIDSRLGNVTADFIAANGGSSTLAIGASVTFTKTYTVLATDSSPLINVATVNATGGGVIVTGTDQASVLIIAPIPNVSVVKTADRLVASVGDVITYTIVVANTGATPLTVNSVIDSRLGNVTADFIAANGGSSTLAIGASVTFTKTYTVLATDSSPMINVATVNATGGGVVVIDTDQASVLVIAPIPSVSILKTADRLVAAVGDTITYTIVVANTGATPLTVNSVIDSRLGNVTADFIAANGGSSVLAVGASATFTKTYTVLATDSSPLINVATVNATGGGVIVTSTSTASVIIGASGAHIEIHKTADRTQASVGDYINYTFEVCNTGTVPLLVISVIDGDMTSHFIAENGGSAILPPGKCVTWVETYKVKSTDTSPHVNSVIITATGGGVTVTDTDTTSVIIIKPGICVEKKANCTTACVGDRVTYTVTLTNTSGVTLNSIVVNDSMFGRLSMFPTKLAIGASCAKTYTYTITSKTPCKLVNTVCVTACKQGSTTKVSGSACWTINILGPSISAASNLRTTSVTSACVALAWNDNSGNETGFRCERATNSTFTSNKVSYTVGANCTTYNNTGVTAGATYYYRVIAYNGAGSASPSNVITVVVPGGTKPSAPTNMRVTSTTATSISIAWTDTANNEQGFNVERSMDGGSTWTVLGQNPANVTSGKDTPLTSGTTYWYRVNAYNANGVSDYSNVISATTQ